MSHLSSTIMAILLLLSGCTTICTGKPLSLKTLKESMLEDIHDMDEDLAITDLIGLSGEKNRQRAFRIVRERQCKSENPNPAMVFIDTVTLNVKGTWSQNTGFSASLPQTAGVTFNVSKGDEQGIVLPLRTVTLSALPDIYLELQLKRLKEIKNLTDPGTDPPRIFKTELQRVTDNYSKLRSTVKNLHESYGSGACLEKRSDKENGGKKQ